MLQKRNYYLAALCAFLITSCAAPIELTTSWSNKTAKVKKSPKVMVMALGKNLANRQSAEAFIVSELEKNGYTAIQSLDVFKPDIKQYDSLTMVNMLRQNNVDMLLTNAVVDIK